MHDVDFAVKTQATPQRGTDAPDAERADRPGAAPAPVAGLAREPVVGRAHGAAEREADHVARDVIAALRRQEALRSSDAVPDEHPVTPAGPVTVRRAASSVPTGGGPATPEVAEVVGQARGAGRPLPDEVRAQFGTAMGTDLDDVRVHTGSAVEAANRSIGAKAFTAGSDVFFRDGMPDATHPDGQAVLAHELAHTQQQHAGVGTVLRLVDDEGVAVDLARVNDPTTTEEQLNTWKKSLDWDEEDLSVAIEARLERIAADRRAASDQQAKEKAERAAEAADKAAAEEKAQLRLEATTAAGGELANYDETLDRTLRAMLKNASIKAPAWSGNFFKAAAEAEPAQTAQEVFNTLSGNEVALEAFIYANAGLTQPAVKTTAKDALDVAAAWALLGDRETAQKGLAKICAQLKAGRLCVVPNVYRAATPTSTAGMTYDFKRLEKNRASAVAELHLHPGRKQDLNNAGLKNGKSGARVTLSAAQYRDIMAAVELAPRSK